MHIHTRMFVFLLLVVSVITLIAACSSGDGGGSSTGAPAASAPIQPQASAPAVAPEAVRPSTLAPLSASAASAPVSRSADTMKGSATVKRLVIGVPAPLNESNAAIGITGTSGWQLGPMYEWVASVDPATGAYSPMLAEEWALTNETIKFKFREGVQFHNGWGEVTAYDFQDAVRDAMHGDNPGSDQYRRNIDNVVVLNDREAILNLKRINVTLFRNLSQFVGGFEIMSKKNLDAVGEYPGLDDKPMAGTGAYQFLERSEGSYVRFKRVPYQHWRVTPEFKELELRFISEEFTRLAALQTGEIHITPLATDLHRVAFDDGMQLVKGTIPAKRTAVEFLCCFLKDREDPSQGYTHPDVPMQDIKVRRALSKAIDRDKLSQALFGGGGELLITMGYNERSDGWNPEWATRYPEQFGYDPAAARSLLAEVGYGPENPYELNVVLATSYRGLPEGQDMMLAMVGMIEGIGVKVKLETMDGNAKSAKLRANKMDNHLDLKVTSSDLFTNVFIYGSSYARTPGVFIIPRLNELHLAARGTMDQAEHTKIFREVGDLMFDNNQNIPLLWIPNTLMYNPEVVAGWVFPGSMVAQYSHFDSVEAAR